jgi:hypothetical protein
MYRVIQTKVEHERSNESAMARRGNQQLKVSYRANESRK